MAGADGAEHLLVAPMKQKGAVAGEATAYDYLKKLEAERAAHEAERLLYVAATRAIRSLHLVGVAVPDERKDDGLKAPAAGSLLKLLWPGVAQPLFAAALATADDAAPTPAGIDPASFVPPLVRLREVGLPEVLRQLPEAPRPADNPLDVEGEAEGLVLEAAVGTLVHRCLELIVGEGLVAWPAARVDGLLPAWQRWLQGQGHDAAAAAAGAAEAQEAVRRTLASERGRWLLAEHAEGGAEQAWSSRDGEATRQHVIDRVFVADGCRWIVDYKTVRVAEAELPRRAEGFRPQLERYAALFRDDPLPLRLAIYFPLQACLHELPWHG